MSTPEQRERARAWIRSNQYLFHDDIVGFLNALLADAERLERLEADLAPCARVVEAAKPSFVRQEDEWGCGVAVIAMVTGQTYPDVLASFDPETIDKNKGLYQPQIEAYLQQRGWFMRRIYSSTAADGVWPPKPFASAHICIVGQPSGNGHWVVMLSDGMVLDPLVGSVLGLGEYKAVNCVIGLQPDALAAIPEPTRQRLAEMTPEEPA